MRHGFHRKKFGSGQDEEQMLRRKLIVNFLSRGTLTSTLTKIKAIRPDTEKIITKLLGGSTADWNRIRNQLGRTKFEGLSMDNLKTALKTAKGGYLKIVKLGFRESDGAPMARMNFAYPVVYETKKPEVKPEKVAAVKKPAEKTKSSKI